MEKKQTKLNACVLYFLSLSLFCLFPSLVEVVIVVVVIIVTYEMDSKWLWRERKKNYIHLDDEDNDEKVGSQMESGDCVI